MTNAVQYLLIKALTEREHILDATLESVEREIRQTRYPGVEAWLDARADELSKECTDIDEVLRLLEAR